MENMEIMENIVLLYPYMRGGGKEIKSSIYGGFEKPVLTLEQ